MREKCRVACRVIWRVFRMTRQRSRLRNEKLRWRLSGLSGFYDRRECLKIGVSTLLLIDGLKPSQLDHRNWLE
jgi:hypothetical protein